MAPRRRATTFTFEWNTRNKGVATSGRGKTSSGQFQIIFNLRHRPRSYPLYFFLYPNINRGNTRRDLSHLPPRRKLITKRRSTTHGTKLGDRRDFRPRPSNVIPTQRYITRTNRPRHLTRHFCLYQPHRSSTTNRL